MSELSGERVRLDRWLWAARFFKTRALAAAAIAAGRVEVNGARAKRAKSVAVGDQLRVRRGPVGDRGGGGGAAGPPRAPGAGRPALARDAAGAPARGGP